ncbi:MAG: cell division protein FtsA, partial [Verrucomicrobiota bacterium]
FEGKEIDAHMLNQVIHMRLREVFEFIQKKIGKGSELAKIGAGIFLTGGSSKMEGIDKLAEEIFELPVQRSSIRSMSGTASAFENPQYSTPMGLVRYAQILDNDKPAKGKGIVGFLKRFKK